MSNFVIKGLFLMSTTIDYSLTFNNDEWLKAFKFVVSSNNCSMKFIINYFFFRNVCLENFSYILVMYVTMANVILDLVAF